MKLILLALLVMASAVGTQSSVAAEPSQPTSEVILVKHASASEVAATLSRIITNGPNGTLAATSPTAALSTGTSANPAGKDFSQNIQNLLRKAAASGDAQERAQSPIIADVRSNSLRIYAAQQDIQRIKEIISRLDHMRPQILVEALVMRVSLKDS